MTRHLPACPKRPEEPGPGVGRHAKPGRVFQLVVSTRYGSTYRPQVEGTADATLDDLDARLRHTWLECCDHLSAFRLGRRNLRPDCAVAGWDDEEPTTISLGELLAPDQELQ
jgi:hypothetical protein